MSTHPHRAPSVPPSVAGFLPPAHRSPAAPLRLALLKEPPIVRAGVVRMLSDHRDLQFVAAESLDALTEPVDLALVDTGAAQGEAGEQVRACLRNPRVSRVAVFAWQPDPVATSQALAAGASGILSKTLGAEQLGAALRRIAAGAVVVERNEKDRGRMTRARDNQLLGLSSREAQVLALICSGYSNEEIARGLFLSPNSIKTYIRTAYAKVGARTRAQAVIWGRDHGLRWEATTRSAVLGGVEPAGLPDGEAGGA